MGEPFTVAVEADELHDVLSGLFDRTIVMVRDTHPTGEPRNVIVSAMATLVSSAIQEAELRLKAAGASTEDMYLACMRGALTAVASQAVANSSNKLPVEVSLFLQVEFGQALAKAHTMRRG